jgi:hypothetical protein
MADVRIENHGTVWLFTPLSERAKALFQGDMETETWQWLGESLGIDHRPARTLAAQLVEAGLEVESNV